MECLRRCLPHVVPEGFQKVRHFGLLHASCALALATIRRLIVPGHPGEDQPPPPPLRRVPRCPTCGAPLGVVMRLWPSPRVCVDTSCEP
jgi:hypothetical protein